MPNWCEGTLKVRGTKESVKKFVLEGLHPVGFMGEKHERLSLNEYGDIDSNETCWIENTDRGFVEGVEVYFSEYEDDKIFIAIFDSKFAWGIDSVSYTHLDVYKRQHKCYTLVFLHIYFLVSSISAINFQILQLNKEKLIFYSFDF